MYPTVHSSPTNRRNSELEQAPKREKKRTTSPKSLSRPPLPSLMQALTPCNGFVIANPWQAGKPG